MQWINELRKWRERKLLKRMATRDGLPEEFTYATSKQLFQALGASSEEAEKQERGLNAVVRREQIRHENKQLGDTK